VCVCRNSVLVLLMGNKWSVQGQEQNNRSHLNWESCNVWVNFKPFQEKSLYSHPCACLPTHTHTHTHTNPHTHTHTHTHTYIHTRTHHIYPLGKIRPPLNLLGTLSSNRPCTKITVNPVEIKPSETEILEKVYKMNRYFTRHNMWPVKVNCLWKKAYCQNVTIKLTAILFLCVIFVSVIQHSRIAWLYCEQLSSS
jgi:hypothetical protein